MYNDDSIYTTFYTEDAWLFLPSEYEGGIENLEDVCSIEIETSSNE